MISIVIPLYNHAAFIAEALHSLIAQTYSDLEIVVVDDGSTDDSLALATATLARHESRFSRVTIVTQANRGVSATLNRGIALATGEFVFLLASDDIAKPTAIETFHRRMITDDSIALVCGDLDLIDESGAPTVVVSNGQPFTSWIQYVTSHRNDIDLVHFFGSYETLICGNYLTVGILLRRQSVLDVGGYDETCPIEDYDLWLKLARHYRFAFVDRQLISYRQHPNGTVVRHRTRILFDELDLLMREFDECVRRNLTDIWRRRVAQLFAAIRYVTLPPPPTSDQPPPPNANSGIIEAGQADTTEPPQEAWQAELSRQKETIEAQAEQLAVAARTHAALEAVRQQLADQVEALHDVVRDREREIGRLFGDASEAHRLLHEVWSSVSWRVTIPLRNASSRLPGLARGLRGVGQRHPHLWDASVETVRKARRMLLPKAPAAKAPPEPAPVSQPEPTPPIIDPPAALPKPPSHPQY